MVFFNTTKPLERLLHLQYAPSYLCSFGADKAFHSSQQTIPPPSLTVAKQNLNLKPSVLVPFLRSCALLPSNWTQQQPVAPWVGMVPTPFCRAEPDASMSLVT
jgi:hypothetical protein